MYEMTKEKGREGYGGRWGIKKKQKGKEDQQSQLTQTWGSFQRLSHQPGAYTWCSEDAGTYRAEVCLVWPQWEKMHLIFERLEA